MPRHKSPADRAALDPEAVLAGRAKVSVAELLDLIHRVNPTGRDRGAREEEVRYAQKSRLQSLLVRRFGASLEVVADPDRDGTVSLLHRGHGRDGCHAVVAALDEDARAWVQLQLDLAAQSERPRAPPPPPRPSGRGTPPPPVVAVATDEEDEEEEAATLSSAVRRAGEAIDAYDYEEGRRQLERALAASGGAPGPAEALLGLLVETLGADGEALALEGSLSRAALATPRARGLLALAAARTGDEARALALVRGVEERQAAAVFAALAAGALSRGDAARAQDHLEQARRRDAGHGALAGLAAEIARARAAERGPIEAQLGVLVAAGRDAEAEQLAGEALARWPESEAARRALRAVEERRRRADAERLAAEAEAALATGDTAAAQARLARALAVVRGPEREALERQVRAIESAERASREARAVERVAGLLAAADPREGLLAYLDLDEALRERAQMSQDVVRWLDLTARGAPHARVDAVLALSRARAHLARGETEAALTTLGPHLATLDRVPEAKRVVREAEAGAAARRAARAREAVAAARAALARGAAAEALRRLDEATLRGAPEPDREAVVALRAEAAAAAARADRISMLGHLRAAGKLFEARRVAEELAANADDPERARWQAERRSLQAAIQGEMRVEVDEERSPIDDTSALSPLISRWDATRWLSADGRSLVMAESYDRWILVHVYDLVDRIVRARVVLEAPERTGNVSLDVTGDTVWLLAGRGVLVALSMTTWEVKLHRPSAEVLPPDTTTASNVFPLSEGSAVPRFLWVEPFAARISHRARVIDLEQRRLGREVPEASRVTDLAGAREPRVVCFRDAALVLYEPGGAAAPGGRVEVPGTTPVGVAVHPDGRGLVVLVRTDPAPDQGRQYAWVVVPEGGPPGPLHLIEGADAECPALIARSGDAAIVAVQFETVTGGTELLVLGVASGALAPLYRVPLSKHAIVAQDAHGRKLVVVECPLRMLAVAEIGATPPELPMWPVPAVLWIDNVIDLVSCLAYKPEDMVGVRELGARVVNLTPASRATLIRNYQRRPNPSVNEGLTVVAALDESGAIGKQEARRLLAWLRERFPSDPEVRLQVANRLAREGRWSEVGRLFEASIDSTGPRAAHFYHLLALAALHAGDPDRARALLAEGRARLSPALCGFQALEELLSPPPDPLAPVVETSSLAQLAEDARAADRCLARGDAAGALAAVSSGRYWTYGDVQLFARMAEAHLRLAPVRGRERFERILVLARFVEAHGEKDLEKRREMPIPGGTWDRARLDALAERAQAWLDAPGGGDESPPAP
jgi:hypothetical protein